MSNNIDYIYKFRRDDGAAWTQDWINISCLLGHNNPVHGLIYNSIIVYKKIHVK